MGTKATKAFVRCELKITCLGGERGGLCRNYIPWHSVIDGLNALYSMPFLGQNLPLFGAQVHGREKPYLDVKSFQLWIMDVNTRTCTCFFQDYAKRREMLTWIRMIIPAGQQVPSGH